MKDSQSKPTNPKVSILFSLAVFGIFLFVINYWITNIYPSWGKTPGHSRDDVFYDSIGYNLANGKGFAIDFQDPDWLAAYSEDDPDASWIFNIEAAGQTTARAPGFPYFVSWVYHAYGRDFDKVRLANMFALAFGLAFLIWCVQSYYGYLAAILSLVLMSADFAIMSSPGKVVSEPLGTGLFAITFALGIWAWNACLTKNSTPWRWAMVGLFFALTLLVRSTLIGWLFQIGGLLIVSVLVKLIRKRNPKKLIQGGFLFLVVVILVCVPWWNRNCQVSGVFTPFGSASSIGFVGGFSEEALRNNGNWSLQAVADRQAQTMREREMTQLTLPQQEFVMGEDSRAEGFKWIQENTDIMPKLSAMKAANHLAITGHENLTIQILNGLLLFGTVVGIYGTWRRLGFWIALVTILSIITTMLTWSHHGRFAIPIRPIWHVGCALGILYVWWPAFRKRQALVQNVNHRDESSVGPR